MEQATTDPVYTHLNTKQPFIRINSETIRLSFQMSMLPQSRKERSKTSFLLLTKKNMAFERFSFLSSDVIFSFWVKSMIDHARNKDRGEFKENPNTTSSGSAYRRPAAARFFVGVDDLLAVDGPAAGRAEELGGLLRPNLTVRQQVAVELLTLPGQTHARDRDRSENHQTHVHHHGRPVRRASTIHNTLGTEYD